ncbi:MAG: translation initiation factor IF-3, partial [Clostridia bacterium]|nr:translation initiation factor IF-3 [Clostridia bacterium]
MGGVCVRGTSSHFCFVLYFNFRRCILISTKETPINEEIRAKEIRVVGPEGEQLGIMSS